MTRTHVGIDFRSTKVAQPAAMAIAAPVHCVPVPVKSDADCIAMDTPITDAAKIATVINWDCLSVSRGGVGGAPTGATCSVQVVPSQYR
jgi:hypothetical protein